MVLRVTENEPAGARKSLFDFTSNSGVERKTVWMTFGPYDFVHVYDAPNDEAMAQFALTLGSIGNVRTMVMRAWDESEHLPLIRALP